MALVATQTAPFRNWARGLAERQGARLVDGEISIGALEGNLFTGATLRDVTIRQDGRVIHDMYLFRVKSPEQSKGEWDLYETLATIPADEAFRPLKDGGCPLVK